jgi:hypothetical protein
MVELFVAAFLRTARLVKAPRPPVARLATPHATCVAPSIKDTDPADRIFTCFVLTRLKTNQS